MKIIAFITNLNVLGGTENNLVSIVSHPEFRSSFMSFIFTGRSAHPSLAKNLHHSGIKVIEITKFANIRVPHFFRNHVFEKHLKSVNPDMVVFWNHMARPGQVSACRKLGAATVFFERGTGWANHNPLQMKEFLSSVDLVLSNSRAGKKILELKWGFEGQCSVLPNAVRPEITGRHSPKPGPGPDRPLRLGIAARLVSYKGVASAVLASGQLKDRGLNIVLDVAGDGPEKKALTDLCAKLGVQARFRGAVEDMAGFYRNIDILICPSLREPFGTVVIEAQAAGCPVICSAIDGLPEIVKDGVTGYTLEPAWETEEYLQYVNSRREMPELVFSPGKGRLVRPMALLPADIASAVMKLTRDPEKYMDMSRAAAGHVRDNYGFKEYVLRLGRTLASS